MEETALMEFILTTVRVNQSITEQTVKKSVSNLYSPSGGIKNPGTHINFSVFNFLAFKKIRSVYILNCTFGFNFFDSFSAIRVA